MLPVGAMNRAPRLTESLLADKHPQTAQAVGGICANASPWSFWRKPKQWRRSSLKLEVAGEYGLYQKG